MDKGADVVLLSCMHFLSLPLYATLLTLFSQLPHLSSFTPLLEHLPCLSLHIVLRKAEVGLGICTVLSA